jgi:hypothetical protein
MPAPTTADVHEYQFGGDYVVTSSASPVAWIAAEQPMLAVDQLDMEVA